MAYKSPTITLPLLHISIMVLGLSLFSSGYKPPFACDPAKRTTTIFPFCNRNLPMEARVADLIGKLNSSEKIRLLVNNAVSVQRLGMRGYEWWSEALHGVSNTGPGVKFGGPIPGATSFPQVITTAASWNASLWQAIGEAVSTEGRAMYNTNQSGLTFWSPNVNILRDPRWGRAQETPGEDPFLTSRYAVNYVRGLQGDDPNHRLKTAACCKHFTAYDLDNWKGVNRFHFNAVVTQQDLEETYNAPFKACVLEGKVASVMCSYNQVNGKPTCADPYLLGDTIRRQWNLQGYIVSDCDSLGVFYHDQHYTSTPEDAAALALKAGLDLDCGPFLALYTQRAINAGKLTEQDVNQALSNLLAVQMRLGMFDGPNGKYDYLSPNDVCTQAHQKLALEAAQQGIVLLQNNAQSLPLSTTKIRSVAIIGPHADDTYTMLGNYAGIPCGYVTPYYGILKYVNGNSVKHVPGCTNVACPNNFHFRQAEDAAKNADATILFMGLSQAFEREGLDRTTLLLPGYQKELILKVASVSKRPVILVLMSGGPIDITFAINNSKIGAILWAGYPGQAGGQAIADVIFGTHNPGGKLTTTWYPESYVDSVQMTNMNMHPDVNTNYPGRTYRYYIGTTLYSFAYGLSYTTFTHTLVQGPRNISISTNSKALKNASMTGKAIRVSQMNCMALSLQVQVDVKNTGRMDGPDTLMIFASTEGGKKQLVAFEKVMLAKGQKKRLKLNIDPCKHMSVVDKYGIRRIRLGQHILHIGGNLKDTMSVQTWAKPTFKGPVP